MNSLLGVARCLAESGSVVGKRDYALLLFSRAFVENLKTYAKGAGLAHVYLHQTRHTYALHWMIPNSPRLAAKLLKPLINPLKKI